METREIIIIIIIIIISSSIVYEKINTPLVYTLIK